MSYNISSGDGYSIGGGFYPLEWTTEAPTQEGWYWVKREDKKEIVQVYKLDGSFYAWTTMDERDHDLNEFTMWLGPLPVPEKPE